MLWLALTFATSATALVCSAPGTGWGGSEQPPISFTVADLDTGAQAAGNEPGIVLNPVLNISSASFAVPDPLYNSVSGWVTAMPRDAAWPWAAAHLGCRWPLGDDLVAALKTFGGAAPTDCDAAAGEWSTADVGGVLVTTYKFKVEVVLCFTELAPAECDDPIAGLDTWQAPAYDIANAWSSTWWAQVLPGHAKLSVCRRLWQTNELTVTANIVVTNTVTDLVAFGEGEVDVNAVSNTVNHTHSAASAALQLGSSHFSIYGEKNAGAGYVAIEVDGAGAYVMNFADRHRFTFALVDENPNDATDVLAAVTEAYNRADVVYDWLVRDFQNTTQWVDASTRYDIAPFYYAAGSLVQSVNANAGTVPTSTTRTSTDVTAFVVEDSITHNGVFIEDDLKLRMVLTWSQARRRRRLTEGATRVALTIAFRTTARSGGGGSDTNWVMIVCACVFIAGVVVWAAVRKNVTEYHRI